MNSRTAWQIYRPTRSPFTCRFISIDSGTRIQDLKRFPILHRQRMLRFTAFQRPVSEQELSAGACLISKGSENRLARLLTEYWLEKRRKTSIPKRHLT